MTSLVMALSLLFLVMSVVLTVSGQFTEVLITVNDSSPVAQINDKFVGVTLDSSLLPTPKAWGGLNLSSAKVQLLASGLSPCYLRIGGTGGDNLTFDSTGQNPDADHTFTGSTWDTINDFVETIGWDLIFGLNALKRKDGQWDSTNAMELLHYTTQNQYILAGLELGNEPDIFPSKYNITISGTQLGKDFTHFKEVLRTLPEFDSTMVLGPDVTGVTGTKTQFFADFLTGGGSEAVDVITIHQYYVNGQTAKIDAFTNAETMDKLIEEIATAQNLSRRTNPNTPLWLGETSSCYHGGAPGLSDTYVAGFLWLDKLGIAARMGVQGVMRQDFFAGNYGLIAPDTFDPLPDYWLTLMYKRLVGNTVLKVETNNTDIRIYAHCVKPDNPYGYEPGSVVMYLLVIDDGMFHLVIPQFETQQADMFWFEPLMDITSQIVYLNGLPLELDDNKFPDMPSVLLREDKLYLPGKTFGFLVFPTADLDICKT